MFKLRRTWRDRWLLLARRLPKKLRYWAVVDKFAEYTVADHPTVNAHDVTAFDLIETE